MDPSAPLLMGVVNVTPDSFSDGGRFVDPARAVQHGLALAASGADIIDVGGESTRPGAPPVAADVQLKRVLPVVEGIRASSKVFISVDTTSAEVAAAALDAGADLVNDISAGRGDLEMFSLVAERGVPIVLMHMLGTPQTMQNEIHYDDVVEDIRRFLMERASAAAEAGIPRSQLVLDPGIGFGKTVAHNVRILAELDRFVELEWPVLVGVSRKSFLGALTGRDVGEREWATAAAVATAVLRGASILRVHDVVGMRDVVRVATAIREA